MDLYTYSINVLCTFIFLFILRIFIVYHRIYKKKKGIPKYRLSATLMIVLGSDEDETGSCNHDQTPDNHKALVNFKECGHTFEMLHLIRNIREKIRPRIYVLADSDILSEQKAKTFEESKKSSSVYSDLFIIEKIPRSREVGQSWFTTIFTTLKACISSFKLVFKHMPDAVLCNGPGTCVPICIAAVFIHLIGLKHITIIFVESICRVKTISLTGKILYYIADYYFVHWPELKAKYPRAEYVGKLI